MSRHCNQRVGDRVGTAASPPPPFLQHAHWCSSQPLPSVYIVSYTVYTLQIQRSTRVQRQRPRPVQPPRTLCPARYAATRRPAITTASPRARDARWVDIEWYFHDFIRVYRFMGEVSIYYIGRIALRFQNTTRHDNLNSTRRLKL